MATNGIDKVYAARLQSDSTAGLLYDTPRLFSQAQELSIKPKYNSDNAYADNRVCDTASALDTVDLTWGRYDMTASEEAYLLGRDLDTNGGVVGADGDNAPYLALLYHAPLRRTISGGKRAERYGILFKTQFQPADSDMKTIQGKPDLSQTPSLTGTGITSDYYYKNTDGIEKHPWEYHIDTDAAGCPADIADSWWNGVYLPAFATLAAFAVSSSTPANNATSVAVGAGLTVTMNNTVANYNGVALLNSTGASVAAEVSLASDGKTIDVTPKDVLTAGASYTLVLAGISDINGRVLTYQTIKFTTAS